MPPWRSRLTACHWAGAHRRALRETAELDELYTYVWHKNAIYVVAEVDRATRCIMSWVALWERTWEAMQRVIEGADPVQRYYSGGYATYETLVYYPGTHAVAVGREPDVQHGGRQG